MRKLTSLDPLCLSSENWSKKWTWFRFWHFRFGFFLFHWLVKADPRVWRHTNLHQKRPASFGWAALPDTFLQTRDFIHPSLDHCPTFGWGSCWSETSETFRWISFNHHPGGRLIPLHLTNVSIIYPDISFRFFLIARTIYLSLLVQLSLPILPLETFSLVTSDCLP